MAPPQPMPYSPRHSQVNPDTPPPPPPKPSSHEASRGGTPLTTTQPFTPPKEALSSQSQQQQQQQQGGGPALPMAVGDDVPPDEAFSSANQAPPPDLDDGWIPDALKNKSTTDLHPLLSNPSLLTSLAHTHPSHASAQSHLHDLLASNTALATRARDLETHLASLRQTTDALALHHGSLELAWRRKQAEMDAALAPWSPKALYQRLAAAVAEQEAVCAAVEESFLEDVGDGAAGEAGGARREEGNGGGAGAGARAGTGGQASEREVVEWVKRVRSEGAKLEARREEKARWDEGRVGGWR